MNRVEVTQVQEQRNGSMRQACRKLWGVGKSLSGEFSVGEQGDRKEGGKDSLVS